MMQLPFRGMLPTLLCGLGMAACTLEIYSQPFASSVVHYEPGTGFAVEFGSGLGYTLTDAALGEPSRVTPGDFGGPVDPFSPPYLREQLLSIGEGGEVVLAFDPPIFNQPGNPYGLDFLVFGNTGFNIINGDYSGGGITDGSIFGRDGAETRVSVSTDHQTYYLLDPEKAPPVDGYFPIDGSGDFTRPVNPKLTASSFQQAGMSEIRSLYAGSGGGAGFDLSWALDTPMLSEVRYVKIEVLSGKVELDAITVVAPQGAGPFLVMDGFDQEPSSTGWRATGDHSLFDWNPEQERMEVTWDSTKPNSYFYHDLGVTLNRRDSFSVSFTLSLDTLAIGNHPDKPFTFPLAVSLLNLEQALRGDYYRGAGLHPQQGPRGVLEWSYHPDSGFGATVSSGLISDDNQWAFQNTFPLELETGAVYTIDMHYRAGEEVLETRMTRNGTAFGAIKTARLSDIFGSPEWFTDFHVDAFAVTSYSDEGQSPPEFAGSILASGWLDDVRVERAPAPRIDAVVPMPGAMALEFMAVAGQRYWLEKSKDLMRWETVATMQAESSGTISMTDAAGEDFAFYRLREGGL